MEEPSRCCAGRATDDPAAPGAERQPCRNGSPCTGPRFDTATYLALVHGYLADPRFTKYYDDAAGVGATEFLVQAVEAANA
ncbi:MAG: TipAS antibiotic-recognition domain-containing protein [Coriobacteriaceae bacterium]